MTSLGGRGGAGDTAARGDIDDVFGGADVADGRRSRQRRRPLLKSARFWVPVSVLVVLIGLVAGGKAIADDALAAKGDLEKAIPLADSVQKSMSAGDTAAAQKTAAQIVALTSSAKEKTSGGLWQSVEWVPVIGPNLEAVRVAAASADILAADALLPLTGIGLEALVPSGGKVDLATLQKLGVAVGKAKDSVDAVEKQLDGVDRDALIPQVAGGVDQLDAAIGKIQPVLGPADTALKMLPSALGADGPKHYLLLFQNNAEARGTGGNPAAIAVITAEDGKLSMTQQAASGDFSNNRATPVMKLNPETQALYGTKIGSWISDITMSPDFTETAQIAQAYWKESFGTPVDGVASFDPVALSYLLKATGPMTLESGEVISSENAVPVLLKDVYATYPTGDEQDAFFAAAAATVFENLMGGKTDTKVLLDGLVRAADEGRLMFAPNDPEQAKMLDGTKISGTLPADNKDATVTGVYVNDRTQSKMDYYMQLDIAAQSQCAADTDAPVFTTTATLTNTLTPQQGQSLPWWVNPAKYFPKGEVATDVVIYAPVGATLSGVTVDGKAVKATAMPHLGRQAVKVFVRDKPGQKSVIAATFTGAPGEHGPLEVRHTPMVRSTPVTVTAPGCQP